MRDTLRWAAREPRVWLSIGAFALVSALAIQDGGAHWLRFGGAAAVLTALSVWWAYQAAFPAEVRRERERARFAEQVTEIMRAHEAQRAAAGLPPRPADGSYAVVPGAVDGAAGWPDAASLGERLDRITELLDAQQRRLADLAAAGDLDAVRAEVAALRERLDGVAGELRTDSAASLRALNEHIDSAVLTLAEALMWPRGGGDPAPVTAPDAAAPARAPAGVRATPEDVPAAPAAPAEVTSADDVAAPEPGVPAGTAPGAATGNPAGRAPGGAKTGGTVRRRKRTRRRG